MKYSTLLTQCENKITSMFGDFFSKRFNSEVFTEKDRFLTGIEIINYSKDEQINFTIKYYRDCQDILNDKKSMIPLRTIKFLKKYR